MLDIDLRPVRDWLVRLQFFAPSCSQFCHSVQMLQWTHLFDPVQQFCRKVDFNDPSCLLIES